MQDVLTQRSLSTAEYLVTLYSAVDKDLQVETSCIIVNYCYVCCSETTLLRGVVQNRMTASLYCVLLSVVSHWSRSVTSSRAPLVCGQAALQTTSVWGGATSCSTPALCPAYTRYRPGALNTHSDTSHLFMREELCTDIIHDIYLLLH